MQPTDINVFLAATKRKLRFTAPEGLISVEDLWDLTLKKLDTIAVGIKTELDKTTTSFLTNPDPIAGKAQSDNELRLEILKAVITTKEEENAAKVAAANLKGRKEFLQRLLEKKQIDQLESLSAEEIEKELAALG